LRVDRNVSGKTHETLFDFYGRVKCFALVVIYNVIFISCVYGCTLNDVSSLLYLTESSLMEVRLFRTF